MHHLKKQVQSEAIDSMKETNYRNSQEKSSELTLVEHCDTGY